jgi:hypothetical protein
MPNEEKQYEDNKLSKIEDKIDKLKEDLHSMQLKMQSLEIAHGGFEQKWKTIINFILQVIWVVMAAYILLKLGLQGPPV